MFDFLPENLRKKAFIAGGWAACPALATDRDVWVTVDHTFDFNQFKQHLEGRALFYSVDYSQNSREYPDGSMKVADLIYPWEKVQIMVTHMSPEQVLEGFDVSTHQIAITADGQVLKGSKWTPTTEPPRKLRNNKTRETDARMEKISKRFGHVYESLSDRVLQRLKGWTFNGQ